VDSLPIPLDRAPLGGPSPGVGALLGRASSPHVTGAAPCSANDPASPTCFPMVVDTGSPITMLDMTQGPGGVQLRHDAFDLMDALDPRAPVRAKFRDIGLLDLALTPVGAAGVQPLGVLGGDVLRAFSVELRFGASSSITFWGHEGAGDGFLADAGFSVLHFALYGGGEVTASGDPDFLGISGPLSLPSTRVVLRACAAADPFVPDGPRASCGKRGCEVTLATGVDVSLLMATGVGPLVLSAQAWSRVAARLPAVPALSSLPRNPLLVATWPTPIAGPVDENGMGGDPAWTTIPRIALVDQESGPNDDLGPCVDLGRARRLEWVSYHQVHPELSGDPCVEVCDTDPRESDKARNGPAYVELGDAIPVAIVADEDAFLQSLRFDVRPQGPEIDGVLGAGALAQAGAGVRMELDYLSTPKRAVISCEPGTDLTSDRTRCWAAARCPRLPDSEHPHYCYGLGPHTMPAACPAATPAVCSP